MTGIIPISEPLNLSDLFGEVVGKNRTSPAISIETCSECGSEFERAHRMGRPVRFCSGKCRRDHGLRQQKEWNSAPCPPPVTACLRCGASLKIRESGPGRARQYCSRRCFFGRRPPPQEEQNLFDLPGQRRTKPITTIKSRKGKS